MQNPERRLAYSIRHISMKMLSIIYLIPVLGLVIPSLLAEYLKHRHTQADKIQIDTACSRTFTSPGSAAGNNGFSCECHSVSLNQIETPSFKTFIWSRWSFP